MESVFFFNFLFFAFICFYMTFYSFCFFVSLAEALERASKSNVDTVNEMELAYHVKDSV